MAYNREFTDQLLKRLENNETHIDYKNEIRFYDLIAEGNEFVGSEVMSFEMKRKYGIE